MDVVFYGNGRDLEYDFIVAPGADLAGIRLRFEGPGELLLDPAGDLLLVMNERAFVQRKPFVYQNIDGHLRKIPSSYKLIGRTLAGFEIEAYNPAAPLVIDPVLSFATLLGGSNADVALDVAVDANGNVYVVGATGSAGFPSTASSWRPSYSGGVSIPMDDDFVIECGDAVLTKFDTAGSIVYSTFFGGSGADFGMSVAVDSEGNAFVAGITSSANFPVTNGAYQETYGGSRLLIEDPPIDIMGDAFLLKLNPEGTAAVYSTYLGGSGNDWPVAIALEATGKLIVAGTTNPQNFPVTPGVVQPAYAGGRPLEEDFPMDIGDGFVARLNETGSALEFSTYLGGSAWDIVTGVAVDSSGSVYLCGATRSNDFPVTAEALQKGARGNNDSFSARLDADGKSLVYLTYLGGTNSDEAMGMALDSSGNSVLTGRTRSNDFPVTPGAFQSVYAGSDEVFVARISSDGKELRFATFLGASGAEQAFRPALDPAGNVYIAGDTRSPNFPLTRDAVKTVFGGGHDGFVAKFNPAGTPLLYSTYFGGSQDNKAMRVVAGPADVVYLAGFASSPDFPTAATAPQRWHAGAYDAFLIKLSDAGSFPHGIVSRVDLLRGSSGVSLRRPPVSLKSPFQWRRSHPAWLFPQR